MSESQVTTFVIFILPVYLVSYLLFVVRAIKGPTTSDTILAIDSISFVSIAMMGILSIFFKSLVLVAVAILLAIWTYSLDVFMAKYLEKKEMGE